MAKNKNKLIIKLEKLMLRSYPVSADEITNEHWAIVKKN